MTVYRAHYKSPRNADPVNGTFDFESSHRAGSRQNETDARMRMLETFGAQAVGWIIDDVSLAPGSPMEGIQEQLDFREAIEPRKRRKSIKRGTL